MATKIQEREEIIVDLLKTTKKPVFINDLLDLTGCSRENLRLQMRKIAKENSEIKVETKINPVTKRQSLAYIWIDNRESRKTYRTYKNSEGYSDMTAEKAIENADEPNITTQNPQAGEVWQTIESNGTNGKIFVLNSLNGAAQCIKLYADTTENREIVGSDPFTIRVGSNDYIGDAAHATFKPLRYCLRCSHAVDTSKLMEARKMIAQAFGIKCFSPNVIEKRVEVPVENTEITKELKEKILELQNEIYRLKKEEPSIDIPENYIDCKTAQIAMLTEQRDIWKNVAEKLLAK